MADVGDGRRRDAGVAEREPELVLELAVARLDDEDAAGLGRLAELVAKLAW